MPERPYPAEADQVSIARQSRQALRALALGISDERQTLRALLRIHSPWLHNLTEEERALCPTLEPRAASRWYEVLSYAARIRSRRATEAPPWARESARVERLLVEMEHATEELNERSPT